MGGSVRKNFSTKGNKESFYKREIGKNHQKLNINIPRAPTTNAKILSKDKPDAKYFGQSPRNIAPIAKTPQGYSDPNLKPAIKPPEVIPEAELQAELGQSSEIAKSTVIRQSIELYNKEKETRRKHNMDPQKNLSTKGIPKNSLV
jgi:hypothetical protein